MVERRLTQLVLISNEFISYMILKNVGKIYSGRSGFTELEQCMWLKVNKIVKIKFIKTRLNLCNKIAQNVYVKARMMKGHLLTCVNSKKGDPTVHTSTQVNYIPGKQFGRHPSHIHLS